MSTEQTELLADPPETPDPPEKPTAWAYTTIEDRRYRARIYPDRIPDDYYNPPDRDHPELGHPPPGAWRFDVEYRTGDGTWRPVRNWTTRWLVWQDVREELWGT